MMKKKLRSLALFMTFVLLFSSVSFAVSAEPAPAAAPTRVMEVEGLRETNAETYLMSDGSYECVVYAYDKYYRTADNTLQLTSSKIVPTAAAERSGKLSAGKTQYKNAANAFDVHFAGSGAPEVSVAYQGASVTFSPMVPLGTSSRQTTGFAVGKVTACKTLDILTYTGDNTVTYSNAFPNTDLVYVLENNTLKEYIILNNANATNTFQFSFALDGVTLESKGKYAEFVDQNGTVLFSLDSLFAVDANGAFTEALSYTFTPTQGKNTVTVTVTLDEAFLTKAAFPVVIDPTIMISSSETQDACVCSYTPNTNYQSVYQLRTGMDTDFGIRKTYIQFVLPSSIPGGSVTAARIELEKLSGGTPTVGAYPVSFEWSAATITWNNQPGYMQYESPLSVPGSNGSNWYAIDVTKIVYSWVNERYPNYGFALCDQTTNDPDHWNTWYSSNAPSPHKPELHITYSPLRFTHYYDGTFSAARRTQIPDVVNKVDYVYFTTFGLEFFSEEELLYDSTLTAQNLDVIRIANQLYNYPRDNNEITVFWTDYEPGDYCFHTNSVHTGQNCPIFEGVALVYLSRPVIHFTTLLPPNGTDINYKVFMSLALIHETAHTFGLPDTFEWSTHDTSGIQCVMENYDETQTGAFRLYYNEIISGNKEAFCSECYDALCEALYS